MGRVLGDTSSASTPRPFSNVTKDATGATTTAPNARGEQNLTSPTSAEATFKGKDNHFDITLAVVVSAMIISILGVGCAVSYFRRWIWGYEDETRHTELMRQPRINSQLPTSRRPTPLRWSKRGVNPKIIAALPVVRYQDLPAAEQAAGKPLECPVCLAVFDATDSLKVLPPCSHAFHTHCIDEWFRYHSTCPLCRASLAIPIATARAEDVHDGRPSPQHHTNLEGMSALADFNVVDVDGDGSISGFQSPVYAEISVPAADTCARGQENEGKDVPANVGVVSSCVSSLGACDIAPANAALASIRRSSSAAADLQPLRHAGYVVEYDVPETQHHPTVQVDATAPLHDEEGNCRSRTLSLPASIGRGVIGASGAIVCKVSGLPCSRCSRACPRCVRRSLPNEGQVPGEAGTGRLT